MCIAKWDICIYNTALGNATDKVKSAFTVQRYKLGTNFQNIKKIQKKKNEITRERHWHEAQNI